MSSFFKFTKILCVVWALAITPQALAQIPGITAPAPAPTQAAKEETPEQTQTRLQNWLKEARASLARLEEPNAEAQLPQGIHPTALADRKRDLDQTIRTITRTASLLNELPNAKTAVQEAETANQSWNGFPEKPPYSILKLDDLVNQRDATKEKNATFQSSLSIFTRSLDGLDKETKANEEANRQALNLVEKEPSNDAAKWRMEAVRIKSRSLSVRALFVRANIDLITEQSAASTAQLKLIERQISVVQKSARITDADLTTIQKSSEDRRAGLRKEITALRERLKDASTGRTRAKTAFDELTAQSAENTASPELALAAARLTAAEVKVDTLQFISDNLESFESLEGYIPMAYEYRKTLTDSKNAPDRKSAMDNLRALHDRLAAWEVVSANELAAANADLAKQESNAAVIPSDDPRIPALADQRKSLWEKQAFLQRISQTVIAHRKNVARWVASFEAEEKGEFWYSDISHSGNSLWNFVRQIWTFEVKRFDTVRNVAGVSITDTRVLTLGAVISAIAFFIFAYALSSRFSRRVQGAIVSRGRIAEAQANTLRNWVMIVVGMVLALTTLHFLEIPLTVFAFFGGALAIGLGFGTQTLIKNFISGIIVLFERKIRVGDILEIDATTSGKVVEINTRSSVLRNGDGKETLIPNSLFLETRVTNLTLSNRRVRRNVRVGVAYGSSPSQVATLLKECTERHGLILKDPAPVVTFEDFGSEALMFAIFFWVEFNDKTDASVVASDIRIMIEKRFSEAGIEFPKSQREVSVLTDKPLQIELVSAPKPDPAPVKKSIP